MPKNVTNKKQFMNGRMTPEELHQKLAIPHSAKCSGCGGRPLIRASVFGPLDEVKAKDPSIELLAQQNPEMFLAMLVPTKLGPFVRISTAFSCKSCRPDLEKTLAKAPSWCFVDIDAGPGADKMVAQKGF